MRKMKDSGVEWIGEIPKEWHIVKIKYLPDKTINNSYTDGDWIESPDVADEGIRYLTTGNIGDGKYKDQGKGFITLETFNRLNCKYAYPGDLIISRLNAPYGRSCILPNDYSEYVLAVDNVILRPTENKKYICYISQCDGYQHSVEDVAKGTTMKRISRTNLGNIFLPIPAKEEQECIVEYLDAKCSKIDKIIEKQQAFIEKLKEYKLSIITEVVTKGLNPDVEMMESGAEFVGKIPQNWSIAKLGNLFDFIGGYAFNSEMYVSESQNQVVRIGNVKNGYMLLDSNPVFVNDETAERVNKFLIKPNYILFTMTGTKGKRDYFFTHVVTEEDCKGKRLYINQRVGCFVAKKGVHPAYYGYLLKDNKILDGIFLYETGTANQGNLGIDSISRTKVHVPPYEEQCKIAEYLDKKCNMIDSNIYEKGRLIIKLQEYKKSLIYEVVTGKKEV